MDRRADSVQVAMLCENVIARELGSHPHGKVRLLVVVPVCACCRGRIGLIMDSLLRPSDRSLFIAS